MVFHRVGQHDTMYMRRYFPTSVIHRSAYQSSPTVQFLLLPFSKLHQDHHLQISFDHPKIKHSATFFLGLLTLGACVAAAPVDARGRVEATNVAPVVRTSIMKTHLLPRRSTYSDPLHVRALKRWRSAPPSRPTETTISMRLRSPCAPPSLATESMMTTRNPIKWLRGNPCESHLLWTEWLGSASGSSPRMISQALLSQNREQLLGLVTSESPQLERGAQFLDFPSYGISGCLTLFSYLGSTVCP